MNKLFCTYPKNINEEKKFNNKEDYIRCKNDKFIVLFEAETGNIEIRCKENPRHLLHGFNLKSYEIKEGGKLEPANNNTDNSNISDGNINSN